MGSALHQTKNFAVTSSLVGNAMQTPLLGDCSFTSAQLQSICARMCDHIGPNKPLNAISTQKIIKVGLMAASRNNIQMGILTSIVALICDLKKKIYKNNTQTNEAIDP